MTQEKPATFDDSLGPLGPGSQLGPYRILSLLGAGGMGQIYRAFDARLGREVAIKVAEQRFSERFDREVRAVAALNHPNICTVHDVGANYLVMELVDGETLRMGVERGLSLDRTLTIAPQILQAIGAAHRGGVIHRDLKPENVMVRADGYVKVMDFGLAKWLPGTLGDHSKSPASSRLSRTGQIVGTLAYMSPEQIQGDDVDPRSDLFAFGIIFYEMLTGRHPWVRPTSVATMYAIVNDDPPVMDPTVVGPHLLAVVETLLRKHPAERYPHAEAVIEALATPSAESFSPSHSAQKQLASVAVLPFVFLNDAAATRALSLGFADSLITILSNLQDVAVAPTSAILNYSHATDPAQVCRELSVRHSLQGKVQRLGSHWRVSVQLFDARTHKVTLSEKYDFDLENVFEVQDEIGRCVVATLQSRFASTVPRARDRYSSDPEAYGEFMAGLRESVSDQYDVLQSAAAHLSMAIERDPAFALAHAWLAHVAMQINFAFDDDRTWLEKAEQHCRRALELDPGCPEAFWARSAILWSPAQNFQHAEALAALEQVLAVRPNFDRAHNRIAAICLHIGRFQEARMAHEQAQRSNPKNRTYNLEYIHLYSGDFARAEAAAVVWLNEAPPSRDTLFFAAQPPLMMGDETLAEQRLAMGLKLHPDEPLIISLQAMLHARRNEPDLALDCVRRSLEIPIIRGHAHHTSYQVACVYALLGETTKAMAWLQRSADTGNPCWPFFKIDPHLQGLRHEPAFVRLVAELEATYTAIRIRRV
jgi:serine/threonine protein kinase/tetratricopeptide (TPR) repeat protein